MTQSSDYRLYLESKFTGQTKLMHAQFEEIHNVLGRIEKQTTETNHRVNKLEDFKSNFEALKVKNKSVFQSILKILGIFFTAVALILSAYFGFMNNEKSDEMLVKQDNQGVPFVTNKRGEFIALPDSTVIKFFPNDSIVYILKKKAK